MFNSATMLYQRIACFLLAFIAIAIPTSASLTDISFIVAGFFGLLISFNSGSFKNYKKEVLSFISIKALIVLFFLFLIGTLYTIAPKHEIFHILGKYSKIPCILLAAPLFAYSRARYYGIWAFSLIMMLSLILSFVLYFYPFNAPWGMMAEGVFRDHIDQNLLMSFFAYIVLITARDHPRYRVPLIIIFALLIYQIFFISGGRTGYVTFIASLLLFSWQTWKWKGVFISLVLAVILIPGFFKLSSMLSARMTEALQNVQQYQQGEKVTSVGLRMVFAHRALKFFKERPFTGYGTGSFAGLYQQIYPNTAEPTRNPHNEYLHLAVQFGILGPLLLLIFLVGCWIDSMSLPLPEAHILQALTLTFALGCLANSWLMDMTPGHLWMFWWIWCLGSRTRLLQASLQAHQ